MKPVYLSIVFIFILLHAAAAQDELLKELEASDEAVTEVVTSTFKGTRIVTGHSVETKGSGALEFIISHRFGTLNSGAYNLWGLDESTIRLGLEYGITDRLGIGVGRSSYDKTFDGYLKYKILEQTNGSVSIPFTITAFTAANYKTSPQASEVPEFESVNRWAYTTQLLIARKFSSVVSFQVMPAWVHKNGADFTISENDLFVLGTGGRVRITKSVAINAEYYLRLNENENSPYFDSIGIGVDIETGGHVFQLILTNSFGMFERAFMTETEGDFFNGDIHLGFNITRTFQLKKK